MSEPRVSVVIPAYRCAAFIGTAINSILAQTRAPDEIIVVDDGSPDDIAAALAPFGERVRLLRKSNGGASSARNMGIDVCSGDFVALLDSDDVWHPGKLASQLAVFQKHPEVGLVASRYLILSPDGSEEVYPGLRQAPWDTVWRPAGPEIFDIVALIWTSSVVIRRETLGHHRFDEHLRTAEDRDMWVRLVSETPIYLQSEITATLVEMKDSLSRSDVDLDCRSMLQLIRRYQHLLGTAGVRRWEANVHRRWAAEYLGVGQSRKAIAPALRRLRVQPLSPEGWWVLGKSMALSVASRLRAGVDRAESAAM